ncbi:saccharopine dehydrogenase-like oxidoreductase [Folsomia candida]|uniref:Saccharopine dehydrogenase-like oxidoreductase n=1 Tax=Folsomia candida TaxID=158441 RepID=A0A226F6C0_FOLCA|nr:saccharopine dehydrogenase-like oxidoreductase [Folsomia candida]OXA64880.1 Saccharopine dehydrogenase-like oxidoreductase [Folsomia candida]
MSRKFDLIVFGATGFTGKYVAETIVKTLKSTPPGESFTWAVAGRSTSKLATILDEISGRTGQDLKSVEKIVADVSDPESIKSMARLGKVVLNCVGPYRFFGEQVVKACVEEGTHHVDVSGEPQFLESMQLKYHKLAEEKGIYVVGSCGFDSIPADCGTVYLVQNFGGDVNSVEEYVETDNGGQPTKIHYGTWQSAIYGLAHANELRPLRSQLYPEPLPKPKYRMTQRKFLHRSDIVEGWCIPFPGSDRSVVMRSQRHFFHQERQHPVQMQAYLKQKSLFEMMCLVIGGMIFGVFVQFKIGKYLLERFPTFFSAGYVTHEGPAPEEMDKLTFTITLVGEGWGEKLLEPTDIHADPPKKTKVVKVRGTNPGYGATCVCLVQAALTILKEDNKMPSKGGVYPPGAAFAKTTLIQRLNQNGVTFTLEG